MKKPYPHLREDLYALDWIKILDDAIKSRKTSWCDPAVREWRNASDEILFALIHALEDRGLIKNSRVIKYTSP